MTPLDAWIAKQPKIVGLLAREFPYGTRVEVGRKVGWVVSWNGEGEVVFSRVDPGPDWMAARIERVFWVEGRLLREMARA